MSEKKHPQDSDNQKKVARIRSVSLTSAGCTSLDPSYQPKVLNEGPVKVDVGEFDSQTESRLLVLYTGGTIGMKSQDGGECIFQYTKYVLTLTSDQ